MTAQPISKVNNELELMMRYENPNIHTFKHTHVHPILWYTRNKYIEVD